MFLLLNGWRGLEYFLFIFQIGWSMVFWKRVLGWLKWKSDFFSQFFVLAEEF